MHVTIVTFGSRGDVQPFLHLAIAFQSAGYSVRLCAHKMFSELVAGQGVAFAAFGGTNPQASQKEDYQKRPKTKLGVLWRILRRSTRPEWEELEQLEDFVANSDLVICNHLADRTYHVTEKLGIPCAFAYLHPTHPTRSFVSTLSPEGRTFGRPLNLLIQLALRHVYWIKNRTWINEWRTQRLGLKPVSWLGPFREQYRKRLPYIFGFSDALIPKINDWPDWYLISGYWFHPKPFTDPISPQLKRFVESGKKPVVIAFGSVASSEMPRILEQTVAAIRSLGERAVVVTGWGDHSLGSTGEVLVTPSVSYEWLFPRALAVIHAGGSGTVAEVTRAGVPSIPVPFAAEQKFWSYRLWRLGVAAKPIHHTEVNQQSVQTALLDIQTRDELKVRAGELADKLKRDRGTAAVVEFLSRRLRQAQAEPEMALEVGIDHAQ